MARPGRPRDGRDLQKARDELKEQRECLRKEISRLPLNLKDRRLYTFMAARLLLTLERGTKYQRALWRPRIEHLRTLARKNGPYEPSLGDLEFLARFIKYHEPDWDWRKDIDDGTLAAQNEAIAQENALIYRTERAKNDRSVTPDVPQIEYLHCLKRIVPDDPTTWPTLRKLKLATAFPERRIRKLVDGLSPNKGEVVVIPLRDRFSKGPAFPKRFGPRLVRALLQEFLNFAQHKAEWKDARQAATAAKRSLAAKLACSRSGT